MDRSTVNKILDAQERFYRDPEYGSLWKELREKDREFLRLLDALPQQQRAVIEDYIGIFLQMQLKLLCCAVEQT